MSAASAKPGHHAAAVRRYLAGGRSDARGIHGADFDAFLPAKPVATFHACGKVWPVYHARNLKGLRTFERVIQLLDPDPDRSAGDRLFELLGVLVGGEWKDGAFVTRLPAAAQDQLSFNELDDLTTLGVRGEGRPQPGEDEATTAEASARPSPSIAASIPETATGT